jgi:serine/threonine-protein kinase
MIQPMRASSPRDGAAAPEKPGAVPSGGASLALAAARYDILLPIASGGMATVYLARSRADGGEAALKIPHAFLAEIAEFRLELIEEARLAEQIRHPNVVAVLDAGESEDGLFLAMEYVEGDTLATLTKASSAAGLPLGIGMRVLLDALAGLHAAHELGDPSGRLAGVVHRDFSPQNILIGLDGVAKLTDFGVARAATRLSNTRTGAIKGGKVAYMSPEQARGLPLDRRCDVWAAGVIAWELIAGRRLHDTDNAAATRFVEVTEEPPPLWTVSADVPPPLAETVAYALRVDVAARCPDAATLARALAAGCRAGGIRIADHEEVGAHVTALVGAKLARRRAEAAEKLAAINAARDALAVRGRF